MTLDPHSRYILARLHYYETFGFLPPQHLSGDDSIRAEKLELAIAARMPLVDVPAWDTSTQLK